MNKAYIVAGYRTAVGKSGKGVFRFTRPDDLAADVVKHLVKSVQNLEKTLKIKKNATFSKKYSIV